MADPSGDEVPPVCEDAPASLLGVGVGSRVLLGRRPGTVLEMERGWVTVRVDGDRNALRVHWPRVRVSPSAGQL